jgi:transcriptional regulator with PAS, ATPase and Fis domain
MWQSSASEARPLIADAAMAELHRVAEKIARGNISVLLLGETGAGKEVLAEAIHRASPRHQAPFQRINCAAITETLFEAELFGHEAGAFTGAHALHEAPRSGWRPYFWMRSVSSRPPLRLLRAIEQRQITRLGSAGPIVDVRFVAATNRDLAMEVELGRFRQDLYFRLNGIVLAVPPLRERPKEVELLARRFLARFAGEMGRAPPELSDRARAVLLEYSWPGNVRELRNAMERACLLAGDEAIDVEHLPLERMRGATTRPEGEGEGEGSEKAKILAALEASGGNQTKAARLLGIGRRTLTTKLTKHQLPRPRK